MISIRRALMSHPELEEVTEGTIEFEGKDLTRMSTEKNRPIGSSSSHGGRRLFAHLTMEENIVGKKGSKVEF